MLLSLKQEWLGLSDPSHFMKDPEKTVDLRLGNLLRDLEHLKCNEVPS